MLKKSIEHIVWLGRYLERLDDTARLITATSHLLIDSHQDTRFSWPVLLEVLGEDSQKMLAQNQLPAGIDPQQYTAEFAVMSHLISDSNSPVSILSACSQLKRNARTIRQLLPRDMWEELNALDLFLQQQCQFAVSRQQRVDLMREVSRRCQMVIGVADGTMLRGAAFDLFNCGRLLERADMTTRIMDVLVLQQLQPDTPSRATFSWISILNALGGIESYQYYLARQQADVDVADYLLTYADFPRSVMYCLNRICASATSLPHASLILSQASTLQTLLRQQQPGHLPTARLHQLLDQVQSGIIGLHHAMMATELPSAALPRSA